MATILIVDDQVLNREFLATLLSYGGHRLLTATDGVEALRVAHQEHPHLIVTDILMPNMDGYEFVSRVRADPTISSTPIIFYTATYREREASTIALACGVEHVLSKPSEPEAILAAVNGALGLPTAQPLALPEMAAAPAAAHERIDDKLAGYIAEVDASGSRMMELVDGRPGGVDRAEMHLVVERLSQSLDNLQKVSLRLTALIEHGMSLAAERDPDRMFRIGCRVAQDLAVARYAVLGIVDGDGRRLLHGAARGVEEAQARPLAESVMHSPILDSLMAARQPYRIAGLNGSPENIGLPAGHPPVHSFLGVPVATPKRSYGWIYLVDKLGDDRFSEIDEQAIATVGAQLATAYENLLLYEELHAKQVQLQAEVEERSRMQDTLEKMLRARTLMALCNHVMIHAGSEEDLLRDMCRTVVGAGAFLMAWIGYAMPDGSIVPQAHAGAENGFLTACAHRWRNGEHDSSPGSVAVHDGRPCVVADIAAADAASCWREPALARGYRSALALPLRDGGQPFGVLVLYGGEPDAFNQDDVELLEELVSDIAYGVVNLRSRVARRRAEEELMATERRLSEIVESIDNIVWSASGDRLLYVSPVIEHVYGRRAEEFYRDMELLMQAIHPEDRARVQSERARLTADGALTHEYRIVRPDGQVRWIEHRSRLADGDGARARRINAVESDVTARKQYEERIAYLASHDALTGLANRNLLNDRLAQAMSHARRSLTLLAVLFLDLDRFKAINDSLGHGTGDRLLLAVAERLRGALRDGDTVARQGGDEFIVLLADLRDVADVMAAVSKIVHLFGEPFRIDGHELHATTSVGVTVYPGDADSPQTLLRNADTAMYQAKAQHGNTSTFYSHEMSEQAMERARLENALYRALEQGEFEVWYQPKPDLGSGRIVGAEALLRWRHPELGMVAPDRFIPIAEEIGLIVPMGDWVLEVVCDQIRAWQAMGLPDVSVAVNMSARQLLREDVVDKVAAQVACAAIPARLLELELTESTVMGSAENFIAKLHALKSLGVMLSIDDFGTGYSSLSYLKRFALDGLKIDKSFIRDIASDPEDAAIARSVIALGHSLNLKVIAEGVETEQQLAFLREHACDQMQGYYFSKALAADGFADLLRRGACLYH